MEDCNSQSPPPPFEPILQFHAVLLYDLLGQSVKLRRLTSLPRTPEELTSTTELLHSTAGAVRGMRQNLLTFYKKVSQSQIALDSLSLPLREAFLRSRAIEAAVHNFSDMTVVNVPLRELPASHLPMASVSALLGAAASMMLLSLTRGSPARGAIDVGLAVDLDATEIYGPVLDQVYSAESRDADWPRILVGSGLLDYLDEVARGDSAEPVAAVQKGLVGIARDLLVEDRDGRMIVDFLGEGMRRRLGERVPFAIVQKACDFVTGERKRFMDAGDVKLANRYENLEAYCEKRAAFWR